MNKIETNNIQMSRFHSEFSSDSIDRMFRYYQLLLHTQEQTPPIIVYNVRRNGNLHVFLQKIICMFWLGLLSLPQGKGCNWENKMFMHRHLFYIYGNRQCVCWEAEEGVQHLFFFYVINNETLFKISLFHFTEIIVKKFRICPYVVCSTPIPSSSCHLLPAFSSPTRLSTFSDFLPTVNRAILAFGA